METHADVRRALHLSALTVVWNTIVGGSAVATAVSTGSLALIGFGINAVVDSSVSVLLVWRFHAEGQGHIERAERAEARAERLAGLAFLVVAIYLTVQSIRALLESGRSDSTAFGIVEMHQRPVLGSGQAKSLCDLAITFIEVNKYAGNKPGNFQLDLCYFRRFHVILR